MRMIRVEVHKQTEKMIMLALVRWLQIFAVIGAVIAVGWYHWK